MRYNFCCFENFRNCTHINHSFVQYVLFIIVFFFFYLEKSARKSPTVGVGKCVGSVVI